MNQRLRAWVRIGIGVEHLVVGVGFLCIPMWRFPWTITSFTLPLLPTIIFWIAGLGVLRKRAWGNAVTILLDFTMVVLLLLAAVVAAVAGLFVWGFLAALLMVAPLALFLALLLAASGVYLAVRTPDVEHGTQSDGLRRQTVVAVCLVSSLLFAVGVPRLHERLMHDHAAARRAAFGAVAEVLDEHDVYTTYELRLVHSILTRPTRAKVNVSILLPADKMPEGVPRKPYGILRWQREFQDLERSVRGVFSRALPHAVVDTVPQTQQGGSARRILGAEAGLTR